MKKQDILSPLIIGEACALIFLAVSGILKMPAFVYKIAPFFPILLPVFSLSGTYITSIFGKKIPTLFQWSKSFLIGILNSFIDLGILNFLMWSSGLSSGIWFPCFKAFSFIVATFNSFLWNKFWAFEKKESEQATKEMVQFFSIAGLGFVINIVVASFLVNVVKAQFGITPALWANLSSIVAIILGFSWNFFGYKFLVFKK